MRLAFVGRRIGLTDPLGPNRVQLRVGHNVGFYNKISTILLDLAHYSYSFWRIYMPSTNSRACCRSCNDLREGYCSVSCRPNSLRRSVGEAANRNDFMKLIFSFLGSMTIFSLLYNIRVAKALSIGSLDDGHRQGAGVGKIGVEYRVLSGERMELYMSTDHTGLGQL
ncbi:hypothetical protein AG1IA_03013 [Rhizoctonia solani AG-1 IA]|uniref:Uncharacterized protein n=1 Tax=Thanatephorus cucumeris (strain AG1-IA) TaxID=983506 RepID=L8WY73_THACA|nr:hypothetical protein AG1IA_03013 [Rhizoctonia solani AG-1 IA]